MGFFSSAVNEKRNFVILVKNVSITTPTHFPLRPFKVLHKSERPP